MALNPKLVVLAAMVALALAACGKKPAESAAGAAAADPGAAAPVLEGQLDLLVWPGYAERGASDPAYDWVGPFEKDTGCKVTVRTAANSDEMVALMNQGGFDLVTASGDASLRLIADGKVQVIDTARVPSYASIDPRLQDAEWHTQEGKHYGVPFQWAPNLLLYSSKVFKQPPTSWGVVFQEQTLPDGKSNKGRVQAFDVPIAIADAALYLMSANPDLGIKDPYELDEAQYAAVLDLLRKQKNLVHRYWHDPAVQVADFKGEGVAASGSWPHQLKLLKAAGQSVAGTIPEEGATGWADTTMMHAQARHPNCAYKWMEYSLTPKVQGDVAAFFGSLPAVPAACNGNTLLGPEGCKDSLVDSFDQIHFWRTPDAKCGEGECVPYSRWTEDYLALIGG
jgi:putative spermidine/putrescine transport system substrate-binding protein